MSDDDSGGNGTGRLEVDPGPPIDEDPPPTRIRALPSAARVERWAGWLQVVGGLLLACVVAVATAAWAARGHLDGLARTADVEPRGIVAAHAAIPSHSATAVQLADHEARMRVLEQIARAQEQRDAEIATDLRYTRRALDSLLTHQRLPRPAPEPEEGPTP